MLPPALLAAADRLITTLMTLVHAVAEFAAPRPAPALPAEAAQNLVLRLANLITTLIRISNFGLRAPADRTAAPRTGPAPATPPARPGPAHGVPRRPGWLLAALPDSAPAIAADLGALLADPALAALLGAAPTLHRALRPILRGLGLAVAETPPPPSTRHAPRHPPPPPGPANPPRRRTSPPQAAALKSTARDPHVPTPISLRCNNKIKAAD